MYHKSDGNDESGENYEIDRIDDYLQLSRRKAFRRCTTKATLENGYI
ncbi:MAG: hypothetical protein JSV75_00010 [Candidatus Bathyarchaeota archaeon]|nr:MAG: hypothetical protein JSV75_00010 [Candidatus Bathyarchaeota archaeon]